LYGFGIAKLAFIQLKYRLDSFYIVLPLLSFNLNNTVVVLMIKFDLTQFQCPQLFVQFKYQLKLVLSDKAQNQDSLVFKVLAESDIKDIERYLKLQNFHYQIQNGSRFNELIISLVRGNN